MQEQPAHFKAEATQSAKHCHVADPIEHYMKSSSEVLKHDIECVVGDCYIGVSYAARRLGNPAAAAEQAQVAVNTAQRIGCTILEAGAQAACAMATFHTDRHVHFYVASLACPLLCLLGWGMAKRTLHACVAGSHSCWNSLQAPLPAQPFGLEHFVNASVCGRAGQQRCPCSAGR